VSILPFESESSQYNNIFDTGGEAKIIDVKNITVNITSYNGNITVYIVIPEPYFKGQDDGEQLIFETPVKMKNDFYRIDPFTIATTFNKNEIEYLRKYSSKRKSVYMRYPQGLVGSDNYFGSYINLYDLLNAIKAKKAAEAAAEREASYQDSKPMNKLKDFFGIDR